MKLGGIEFVTSLLLLEFYFIDYANIARGENKEL
jgi:hypothetical protein